jgi:hypothetical protein
VISSVSWILADTAMVSFDFESFFVFFKTKSDAIGAVKI